MEAVVVADIEARAELSDSEEDGDDGGDEIFEIEEISFSAGGEAIPDSKIDLM